MDEAKPDEPQSPERESRLRSALKGISWRLLATTITGLTAFILSKDVWLAVKIAMIEFPAKFIIYYAHERAWASVPMGTVREWIGSGGK
ncbi:MAG: hypothetical protein CMO78_03840 [Verrucomicrobiales bacterium]|nr:hypothetical protein [Verrucomicrobiales bacterium]